MDGHLNLNVGAESDDSEAEEVEKSKEVSRKVRRKEGMAKRKESRSGSDTESSSGSDTESSSGSDTMGGEGELQMDVEERGLTRPDGPFHVADRQDVPAHLEDNLGGPLIEEPEETGEERDQKGQEEGRKVVTIQGQQAVNVKENTGLSQLAEVIKHQNPEKIIFVSNCSGTFNF